MDIIVKNKRRPELVKNPFSGCQISSEVSFVNPHQANFDVLFQRGF